MNKNTINGIKSNDLILKKYPKPSVNSLIKLQKSHLSKKKCNSSIKYDINFTDNIDMETSGRKLYQTNNFYKSLANLMTNPDFKVILDNFWSNDIEIKSFIMYIQLYQYINETFPTLSEYKKIHIIKMLIDNKTSREIICKDFNKLFTTINSTKKINHMI